MVNNLKALITQVDVTNLAIKKHNSQYQNKILDLKKHKNNRIAGHQVQVSNQNSKDKYLSTQMHRMVSKMQVAKVNYLTIQNCGIIQTNRCFFENVQIVIHMDFRSKEKWLKCIQILSTHTIDPNNVGQTFDADYKERQEMPKILINMKINMNNHMYLTFKFALSSIIAANVSNIAHVISSAFAART